MHSRIILNISILSIFIFLVTPTFVSGVSGHAKAYPVRGNEAQTTEKKPTELPDFNKDLVITVEYPDEGVCDSNTINFIPEDPGEKGKETIEGVDSDGDSVRDDLEIFIWDLLPKEIHEQARYYLYIRAIWFDKLLRENLDIKKAYEISNHLYASSSCYIKSISDKSEKKLLKKVFANHLNTYPRSVRYIENNSLLGGVTSRATITVVCN